MDIRSANYPKNCWWVAAQADEVGDRPLGRWLLGEPVVLFRTAAGAVVALEDRCPHRWLPLSKGRVLGNVIVCGYHGLRFGADGHCVKTASHGRVPDAAKVRSYPVVERGPFVWIWMGDPKRSSETPIPDLEFVTGADWVRISGYMYLKSNYFLLQENVLDLTHFAYVHAHTLEVDGWDGGEDEVLTEDGKVKFRRHLPATPLPPFLTIPAHLADGEVGDSTTFGELSLPGVHSAGIDIGDPWKGKNGGRDFHFRISHLTTPESPSTTHYWWIIGQNYGAPGSKENEDVRKIIVEAFLQDKEVLENIQQVVERDSRHTDSPEISMRSDRSGIQARKILHGFLDRD